MTTTQATATDTRFYIVAGGLRVTGPYGWFPEDCAPSTWETHDDIRTCGGGWFRSEARAEAAAKALEDHGIFFASIVPAASKAEAMNVRRVEEQARLRGIGLA